jgi:hypothetical protein
MQSPFARLGFFYAAASHPETARELVYPMAPDPEADAAARRLATRLRETPEGQRASLLRVLKAQAALIPFSAIHPSWLENVLADCRPQWRVWALHVLPAALRDQLQVDRPEAAGASLLEAQPPPWWAEWFAGHVKRRLAYPDLEPWGQGSGASSLPGSLWEHGEAELTRALAVHGTRGFVSAVRQLPREEAQQWMWRLPAQCQGVAREVVEQRRWSEDPFWPAVFQDLAEEFPEVEARLFRLALADWLRAGVAERQEPQLRRLAFRLPRRWGEWMLRELSAKAEWLSLPVLPSLEAWKKALVADLGLAAAATSTLPPASPGGAAS